MQCCKDLIVDAPVEKKGKNHGRIVWARELPLAMCLQSLRLYEGACTSQAASSPFSRGERAAARERDHPSENLPLSSGIDGAVKTDFASL
jgi:hypothetical protein